MIGHAEKAAAKEAISKAGRIWRVTLLIVAVATVLFLVSKPAFQWTIGGLRYSIERVQE